VGPVKKRHLEILSVEDNAADVKLITELLGMSQVPSKLNVVRDGAEALDYLLQKNQYTMAPQPDLVLLDLSLPKIDGREVLKTVKESPILKHIPVLILTGSDNKEDIRGSYELHANSYIVKPFDLNELSNVVRGIEEFWLTLAELPGTETKSGPSFHSPASS
jgi:two-component system, chemotaxis family, response regulator Rcp1